MLRVTLAKLLFLIQKSLPCTNCKNLLQRSTQWKNKTTRINRIKHLSYTLQAIVKASLFCCYFTKSA
ncbi:hypothetical protein KC19_5G165000 [Ceratodon purpureus]|uniref:Uncharacterized protein n=1 Tax=Ceratodon purpureus TaxID=3225 RepID=A0A8T0I525_CERPU|nr:hypothetical protein KC19_5G165000 [Ceratodon purpureus]